MNKNESQSADIKILVEDVKINLPTETTNLESVDKNKKLKTFIIFGAFISVPVTLLIGLLINYLVYYPKTVDSNGVLHGKFTVNSETLTSVIIVSVMCLFIMAFTIFLVLAMKKRAVFDDTKKTWQLTSIGFTASFFDAIGVGSYGIAIGLMKATKTTGEDKLIPGTLTVGLAIPQMMEATIFVGAIQVEWQTLLILTACSVVGGLLGALIANKINNQVFRIIIGVAMFVIAIIMILVHPTVSVIKLSSSGTLGLSGWKLAVGSIAFLILGGTSALGLGMFAPSLALLTLLGMSTEAIFPIMSLASACMMPPAAIKFFRDKNYQSLHSITFTLGGVFGTLTSFLVVFVGLQVGAGMDKETFNDVLKWIAIVVVFYCSFLMLFDFSKDYKKNGWHSTPGGEIM